jgi:hypothetical protein
MAEPSKATSISVAELESHVSKAVEGLAFRDQLHPQLVIDPATLIGRVLRENLVELEGAQAAATELTEKVVSARGLRAGALEPAIAWRPGYVTIGFIAREVESFASGG